MHPAWDQIIARPLRCGLREDGRLDFDVPGVAQEPPSDLHQPMLEDDRVLQLRATKVQVPVAKTQLFRWEAFALPSCDWNDRGYRRSDDPDRSGVHLDLSSR